MSSLPAEHHHTTQTRGASLPGSVERMPKRRIIIGLSVILAALLALMLIFAERETAREKPTPTLNVDGDTVSISEGAPQWAYITLKTAALAPTIPPLPAPGRVVFDAKRTANVGAPLAGRVETVMVRVGDTVKKGEKLFSVRSAAFADLDRDLGSTREDVEVKSRLYERQKELLELKAVSEKDVMVAESELKQAQLALRAARAKESSLSVSTDGNNLFWVLAPRGGVVVQLSVVASQQVNPDASEPLVRISDLDEVLVIAEVPEIDAVDAKVGQKVTVVARDGNASREGVVDYISQVVDPLRQTVETRIRLDNRDRLMRPNAFVEATLEPDASTQRVQVPEDAVVLSSERSVVFVEQSTGRLQRVVVQPGRRRDHQVEIRSGLAPGTKYVAKGALLLLNQVELAD